MSRGMGRRSERRLGGDEQRDGTEIRKELGGDEQRDGTEIRKEVGWR